MEAVAGVLGMGAWMSSARSRKPTASSAAWKCWRMPACLAIRAWLSAERDSSPALCFVSSSAVASVSSAAWKCCFARSCWCIFAFESAESDASPLLWCVSWSAVASVSRATLKWALARSWRRILSWALPAKPSRLAAGRNASSAATPKRAACAWRSRSAGVAGVDAMSSGTSATGASASPPPSRSSGTSAARSCAFFASSAARATAATKFVSGSSSRPTARFTASLSARFRRAMALMALFFVSSL